MRVAAAALITVASGCSFALGTPASYGLPSSNPDDYAYTTGPTCHIYEKTAHVDLIVALVSSAVSVTGIVLRTEENALGTRLAVAGGALAVPFLASGVAGSVGRSRCHRWGRELPLSPPP